MELNKYAAHHLKLELMKANIEVFQNESGRKGLDFIIKTTSGNYHELYLQSFNIETENKIKVLKEELRETKANFWLVIAMVTKNMDCSFYFIPSSILLKPDQKKFINYHNNSQPYWEIKVSIEAFPELSKYSLNNMKSIL